MQKKQCFSTTREYKLPAAAVQLEKRWFFTLQKILQINICDCNIIPFSTQYEIDVSREVAFSARSIFSLRSRSSCALSIVCFGKKSTHIIIKGSKKGEKGRELEFFEGGRIKNHTIQMRNDPRLSGSKHSIKSFCSSSL